MTQDERDRIATNILRRKLAYTVTVDCTSCKDGTMTTGEGRVIACAYCRGTRQRQEKRPHPSHQMTEFKSEIRCPGSEPRHYSVRQCTVCGEEELSHPAGHFLGELGFPCIP